MYHGRTATWVYGQGTRFHTMTATAQIRGEPVGPARFTVVGIDSEDEPKTPMRLTINDILIYEGPNPLPNDDCCGNRGPGNWGGVTFELPPGILRSGNNRISITNLDPSDEIFLPIFVMVDRAVLEFRSR